MREDEIYVTCLTQPSEVFLDVRDMGLRERRVIVTPLLTIEIIMGKTDVTHVFIA